MILAQHKVLVAEVILETGMVVLQVMAVAKVTGLDLAAEAEAKHLVHQDHQEVEVAAVAEVTMVVDLPFRRCASDAGGLTKPKTAPGRQKGLVRL